MPEFIGNPFPLNKGTIDSISSQISQEEMRHADQSTAPEPANAGEGVQPSKSTALSNVNNNGLQTNAPFHVQNLWLGGENHSFPIPFLEKIQIPIVTATS